MASSNPRSNNNTAATTTVTEEETPEGTEETLRLKLKKGAAAEKKKIQWTEDTVDNEGVPLFLNFHNFSQKKNSFLLIF